MSLLIKPENGLLSLENDVENPEESPIFNNYSTIVKNHHLLNFISDNLKVILTGVMQPHELENLMEVDMETVHRKSTCRSMPFKKLPMDFLPLVLWQQLWVS